MKRTTIILLIAALASAASALASVAPGERTELEPASGHETVIEKNQAFPLVGPFTVEECLDAECTQTRS